MIAIHENQFSHVGNGDASSTIVFVSADLYSLGGARVARYLPGAQVFGSKEGDEKGFAPISSIPSIGSMVSWTDVQLLVHFFVFTYLAALISYSFLVVENGDGSVTLVSLIFCTDFFTYFLPHGEQHIQL